MAPQKRRIFKIEIEMKLDHQSSVKFLGDYDGGIFKSKKPNFDPLIGRNSNCPKFKNFHFELELKVNRQSRVEFRGDDDGDSCKT